MKIIYAIVLCVFTILNIAPFGKVMLYNINNSRDTAAALSFISHEAKDKEVTVSFYCPDINGIQYNLKDYGIDNYNVVKYEEINDKYTQTYSYWLYYMIN